MPPANLVESTASDGHPDFCTGRLKRIPIARCALRANRNPNFRVDTTLAFTDCGTIDGPQ
jgi:hypothetical protein